MVDNYLDTRYAACSSRMYVRTRSPHRRTRRVLYSHVPEGARAVSGNSKTMPTTGPLGSEWRNSDSALATRASFGPNVLLFIWLRRNDRRVHSYFDYPLPDMSNRKRTLAFKEPSYIYAFYKRRFTTIEFLFFQSGIKSTCFKLTFFLDGSRINCTEKKGYNNPNLVN